MNKSILLAFLLYFIIVIGIGVYFYYRLKSMKDYFLGGRNLNSWVTAMSAQASDMSGWLLMGLPAAAYFYGVSASWIAIGLAIGTYVNWKIIARRLRKFTAASKDAITIPQYLKQRFCSNSPLISIICSFVIFIFFLVYTASGFNAGARVFQYIFHIDYTLAVSIGAAVILVYTFLGGFLAACWTDFFQGMLMLFALIIVPFFAFSATPDASLEMLANANGGNYLNLFSSSTSKVPLITIISSLAWGLGYFGMPHILVRFMAISSSDKIKKARRIAMVWVILSLFSAVAVGVIGYIYLKSIGIVYSSAKDAEIVFIDSVVHLISSFPAGILLSAVFAAIMSTAASQLLVTASTISNDFYKLLIRPKARNKELMLVSRMAVVLTVVVAYVMALNPNNSVMGLVAYAWAGFGAAFGPSILLSLFWRRMTIQGALAGILFGGTTILLWENLSILKNTGLYSLLPGFFIGLFAVIIGSLLSEKPSEKVGDIFEKAMNTNV